MKYQHFHVGYSGQLIKTQKNEIAFIDFSAFMDPTPVYNLVLSVMFYNLVKSQKVKK